MDLSDHRLLLYGSVFLLPAVITLVVWTLLDALRVETMYLETDLERVRSDFIIAYIAIRPW